MLGLGKQKKMFCVKDMNLAEWCFAGCVPRGSSYRNLTLAKDNPP